MKHLKILLPVFLLISGISFSNFNQEKEMVGVYISGHPLDDFKLEIDNFCNSTFNQLNTKSEELRGKEIAFAGIVSEVLILGAIEKDGKVVLVHPSQKTENGLEIA